jgi:hypothetical protein
VPYFDASVTRDQAQTRIAARIGGFRYAEGLLGRGIVPLRRRGSGIRSATVPDVAAIAANSDSGGGSARRHRRRSTA